MPTRRSVALISLILLSLALIGCALPTAHPIYPTPNGTHPPTGPGPDQRRIHLCAEEKELLARLVTAESCGEPYTGMVAVAASVLNRVDHVDYPNTVTDVIYQVVAGIYYQYEPVLNGRINLPACEEAYRAVEDAIRGSDPSLGATGFFNPAKTDNQWVRSRPVTVIIANHVFFR